MKATYPSDAGSSDGISMVRVGRRIDGQSRNSANTDVKVFIVTAIESRTATSISSPRPRARTDRTAASTATAAYVPAIHSPILPPAASGGPSGRPREPVEPHHAWSVNSVAAQSRHGPSSPNGVIDATTRSGRPRRKATTSSGREPSQTTTSAPTRRSSSASPSARTTDRFDVLRNSNSAPEPQDRIGSPAAVSTFTTSAPASASSFVQ